MEYFILIFVIALSIGEGYLNYVVLKQIEIDLQILNTLNSKTNERLDRLINTAQSQIFQIAKNIDDIFNKLE
jgi:hypothetical protein